MGFWRRWFGRRPDAEAGEPLEIDQVLAAGLRDARSAREALAHLAGERQRLMEQRKVVDAQFNRVTPGQVKLIARSNDGNPQTQEYLLTHAMRGADAANQQARSDQLAEIESRMQAVDRAEAELRAFLQRVG